MKTDDKYQEVFNDFEVPDPIRIKKVIRLVKKHFNGIKGLKILECGIARGGVADLLLKEGAICVGIDVNPRFLSGIKIYQHDLNDGFPEMKEGFDVIFAGEVMEHLFDEVKFLQGAKKLLKPDGLIILSVPNLVFSFNRFNMLLGRMPTFVYAPFHYHIYNKKTLEELLKKQGFEITDIVSSHVLFSTRRNKFGRIFEILGDIFPSWGAHLIVSARKTND